MHDSKLRVTPSQTIGPFFAYSLTAEQYGYDYNSLVNGTLTGDDDAGARIRITGGVFDGKAQIIPDALVELWQAGSGGDYRSMPIRKKTMALPASARLGTGTGPQHHFCFTTVRPGPVGAQAPHINVIVFMRGSLHHLYTRMYFPDEAEANGRDALLNLVPEERKHTLIAQQITSAGSPGYHFDIHLQGENETVFFDVYNSR